MHDLTTAGQILNDQVEQCSEYYFTYVEHRLAEALATVQQARQRFVNTHGDPHTVKQLVSDLSHLDLGHERAISVINRVSKIQEEIVILEELDKQE